MSYRFRNIDSVSFEERGGWVASVQKYFLAVLVGSKDNLYRYFAPSKIPIQIVFGANQNS